MAAIDLLWRLEGERLCLRAIAGQVTDQPLLAQIHELAGLARSRECGLTRLLNPSMLERLDIDVRHRPSPAKLQKNRQLLLNDATPEADKKEALVLIASSNDEQSIPLIATLIQEGKLTEPLMIEAATTLDVIGSDTAKALLIDVLRVEVPSSRWVRQTARRSLQHSLGGQARLDANGRDLLIRRIASLPCDNPDIDLMVSSLKNFPIATGRRLLSHWVGKADVPGSVRLHCLEVLLLGMDGDEVSELLVRVAEFDEPMQGLLLSEAVKRRLLVDVDWLLRQFRAASSAKDRKFYLTVICSMFSVMPAPPSGLMKVIDLWVSVALGGEGDEQAALILRQSIEGLDDFLAESSWGALSQSVIERATLDFDISTPERLKLAVVLLGHRGDDNASDVVRRCLDKLLESHRTSPSTALDAVASCVAKAWVRADVALLLEYPADWQPVRLALLAASEEFGWLVYDDTIVDAEGTVIATNPRTSRSTSLAVTERPASSVTVSISAVSEGKAAPSDAVIRMELIWEVLRVSLEAFCPPYMIYANQIWASLNAGTRSKRMKRVAVEFLQSRYGQDAALNLKLSPQLSVNRGAFEDLCRNNRLLVLDMVCGLVKQAEPFEFGRHVFLCSCCGCLNAPIGQFGVCPAVCAACDASLQALNSYQSTLPSLSRCNECGHNYATRAEATEWSHPYRRKYNRCVKCQKTELGSHAARRG
jgi:hypothetical protein